LKLAFWCVQTTAQAQYSPKQIPEKSRILFLLDASGSMLAPWENDIRMNVAKKLLADLVDSLKANTNLELALRVYGHQFPNRQLNCTDSKLEVPFRSGNHDQIKKKLFAIEPKGTTPIAYSLEQAAGDFPQTTEFRNIVIIITDGLESCNGDPCQVSKALQEKNIFLKPFIIGLGATEGWEKQFECVGKYFDANNVNEFREVLNKVLKHTLDKTTLSVELLDINGLPKETNVNVSLVNQVNGDYLNEMVHYRDKNGRTDSVEVDALIHYDIIVNTIPPVYKRNVQLNGGKHNVVSVKSPQGKLKLNQHGASEYPGGVKIIVRETGKKETLHLQQINTEETYLVGQYDLEVLTLPRTFYREVTITQSKTTSITVAEPGLLNVSSNTQGYGSLYKINENGTQTWIHNLSMENRKATLAIQPGRYKLVFRAKDAHGSKFTETKTFSVNSGGAINIKLFGR
jgi:Ca-activated chloride channel homolog